MSTQIAVRLPEELVDQLDARVRQGMAANRTELIRTILASELRRVDIAAEQAVLAQPWDDRDDLTGLAEWASRQPSEH